jgi:gliding motility-associated-like protein
MKKLLVLLLLSSSVYAQEICTNGIDDDADGLIDLNDTSDCICNSGTAIPVSLIPNPSFEEFDCLPQGYSELSCASTWEQASDATSDYLVDTTAGLSFFMPGTPLPLPDGNSVAGFHIVDSLFNGFTDVPYNEYLGACLLGTMQAGEQYTLTMKIAGAPIDSFNNPTTVYPFVAPYGPVDITLYGSVSCPTWPIAVQNTYGCPIGTADWEVLGTASYVSEGIWKTVTITFTPAFNYQAIMIGGPCNIPPGYAFDLGYLPYFLADQLTLNKTSLFGNTITVSGSFCENNLVLAGSSDSLTATYQWFNNGVAIAGQTDTLLNMSTLGLSAGTYQFGTYLNGNCTIGEVVISPTPLVLPAIQNLPNEGCLPLDVSFVNTTAVATDSLVWQFGDGATATADSTGHIYTNPGTYDVTLTVYLNGCSYDTVFVDAINVIDCYALCTASINAAGGVCEESKVQFSLLTDSLITSVEWDFGDPASGAANTSVDFNPEHTYNNEGNYTITANITLSCGVRNVAYTWQVVNCDTVLPCNINIPNIFTVNADAVNDELIIESNCIPEIYDLSIFNSWGEMVFATTDFSVNWDGKNKDSNCPAGVYYYILKCAFLTDPMKTYKGFVTILK